MTIFDFGKGVPSCVRTEGGKVSTTDLMVKQGTGSLRWDFKEGDKLIFDTDIGYQILAPDGKDFRVYVFGMYMFGFGNEGFLHVGFHKNGEEQVSIDVQLGFSGWRSATACFDRDMKGKAVDGMDSMVITAHSSGSLLFSEVVTANRVDQRHILKSYQVPTVNNNEFLFVKDWTLSKKYSSIKPDTVVVNTVKQRAFAYLKAEFGNSDIKKYDFSEIEEKASKFEITENELGITGKRVEWYNQRRIVDGTEWKDEKIVSLRTITNLMLDIAGYYMQTADKKAADLYIKILRYIIVQGFSEGSSLGTHKILDYGIRPFYTSAMIMSEVIEENGLTDHVVKAMFWFIHAYSTGICDEVPFKKASSDDFFNSARGLLFAILMMKDESIKTGCLAAFGDWVSQSLDVSIGLRGMFKEDGCIYHHHGHYISYGQTGLSGITPVAYALSGTPFEISEKAYNNVRTVLFAMHFQCNKTEVPIALSGRHPTGKEATYPENYKYFALCAIERGDLEAAGLYLSIKDEPADELDRLIFEKAAKDVNTRGNRSYPMACTNIHKRKGFMTVAKGYSKYLWGSEIYKADNLYGRYRSYGVLELINEKNHFSHDGYDWNRFPGATTIHLPIDDLKADVLNVDAKSGFEEMLLSDQSFAGSVSLGDNGMFSMILSAHPKYDGTHKAHKSIFFYDDFILLLGSGISNESKFETETTLYQVSLNNSVGKPLLNGKEFSGEYVINEGDVVSDGFGNNYYIKEGTKVSFSCGLQQSRHSENSEVTEGEFGTAVICHGVSPENASYEYSIGACGGAKCDYEILEQNDSVHAVKIGNITYMAIFEPEKCSKVKSNLPIMLMMEESAEETKLSVCNPDLGLYDEDPSQYDENGVQREVSIYSRAWTQNPVSTKKVKLEIENLGFSLDADLKGGCIYTFKIKNK